VVQGARHRRGWCRSCGPAARNGNIGDGKDFVLPLSRPSASGTRRARRRSGIEGLTLNKNVTRAASRRAALTRMKLAMFRQKESLYHDTREAQKVFNLVKANDSKNR